MIPEAAVEAAKAVLLGYTGGCVCHEGYSGRNLIDPECTYHDVPPEVAALILEAAAPHIAAQALEDAAYIFEGLPMNKGASVSSGTYDWFELFPIQHMRDRAEETRTTK